VSLAGALAALTGAEGLASAQALAFYRVPLFLLPIYKAAAVQYGVPWQFLAAINEIETDYGSDLSVSTAGAVGWMQFMPATWLQYGVDALNAGYADPYNPVDAIFAAARYLRAAGAASDLRGAIFAYNHSEEYVESVLLRAKLISTYPKSVIATLTGLVDGRLPVSGKQVAWEGLPGAPSSTTANPGAPSSEASSGSTGASGSSGTSEGASGGPQGSSGGGTQAQSSPPSPTAAGAGAQSSSSESAQAPRFLDVRSAPSASVVAVQDGRVLQIGDSRQLGKYVVLRDVYGDVYTYAGLGSIAGSYSPPKAETSARRSAAVEAASTRAPAPTRPASAGVQTPLTLSVKKPIRAHPTSVAPSSASPSPSSAPAPTASQAPPGNSLGALLASVSELFRPFFHVPSHHARPAAAKAHHNGTGQQVPLRRGSVVESGTVLGRVRVPAGARDGHTQFEIRPAGDSATIDPAPILANWAELQAALHPHGAKATNPLLGATASDVFLLTKAQLKSAVLSDPGITITACGRHEIEADAIDGRVLAVLAFLSRSGLRPAVNTPSCVEAESAGSGPQPAQGTQAGVDIFSINGTSIAGHQGAGTITDLAIRTLLALPAEFVPSEITSLMQYSGSQNTRAQSDHWNRIELHFNPAPAATPGQGSAGATARSAASGRPAPSPLSVPASSSVIRANPLSVAQWNQLMRRVSELPTPTLATKPSSSAVPDPKRP
jgi:Transglycosylase SLT domain